MREIFPHNRVEYFVSYYDYYQPEAYIPSSDTYIEKDSSINDEIDRLRHSATSALLTRRDVIVVASVSCIYGLGSPEEYSQQILALAVGQQHDQRAMLGRLVDMQYERNDSNLVRGKFRVRGDTIEVHPAYEEHILRIELFGDEVERITRVDPVTGELLGRGRRGRRFPGHPLRRRAPSACGRPSRASRSSCRSAWRYFESDGQAARGAAPTHAYELRPRDDGRGRAAAPGIENYSRHIDGRAAGASPAHAARLLPEGLPARHRRIARGRAAAARPVPRRPFPQGDLDRARVPAPLRRRQPAAALRGAVGAASTSAYSCRRPRRPTRYRCPTQVVEQIVRPTGLVDPEVVVRPTKGQIDDLIAEISQAGRRPAGGCWSRPSPRRWPRT